VRDNADGRALRSRAPEAARPADADHGYAGRLVAIGMLCVAWWKAAAPAVDAFLILAPRPGAFTPRPESRHHVARSGTTCAGGHDDLRESSRIRPRLDEVGESPPT
jgi:hypothetical protein